MNRQEVFEIQHLVSRLFEFIVMFLTIKGLQFATSGYVGRHPARPVLNPSSGHFVRNSHNRVDEPCWKLVHPSLINITQTAFPWPVTFASYDADEIYNTLSFFLLAIPPLYRGSTRQLWYDACKFQHSKKLTRRRSICMLEK
jgi:hypothetical protein